MPLIFKIAITAIAIGLGVGATSLVTESDLTGASAIVLVLLGILGMIVGGLIALWS